MANTDEIDLPRNRIENKVPVYREFALPNVYPGERYRTTLYWNAVDEMWMYDFEWVDYQQLIDPRRARLRDPVMYQDILRVIFIDPSGRAEGVTPANLGRTVQMTVWPGPDSPVYEPLPDGREPWEPLIAPIDDLGGRYDAPQAETAATYDESKYDESTYN